MVKFLRNLEIYLLIFCFSMQGVEFSTMVPCVDISKDTLRALVTGIDSSTVIKDLKSDISAPLIQDSKSSSTGLIKTVNIEKMINDLSKEDTTNFSQWTILSDLKDKAFSNGIWLDSLHDASDILANKDKDISIPIINTGQRTYETAKKVFKSAKDYNSGLFVFEIDRSQIGSEADQQKFPEFVSYILAAAITEGSNGPVFIQFKCPVNAEELKKGEEAKNEELNKVKNLIWNALDSGVNQIFIDISTFNGKGDCSEILAYLTMFIRNERSKSKTFPVKISVGFGEVVDNKAALNMIDGFMNGYTARIKEMKIKDGLSGIGILPKNSRNTVDIELFRAISSYVNKKYKLPVRFQSNIDVKDISDVYTSNFIEVPFEIESVLRKSREEISFKLNDLDIEAEVDEELEDKLISETENNNIGKIFDKLNVSNTQDDVKSFAHIPVFLSKNTDFKSSSTGMPAYEIPIKLGLQGAGTTKEGAGTTSVPTYRSVKEFGVTWVILRHSDIVEGYEKMNLTPEQIDAIVNKQLKEALEAREIKEITVCVGEDIEESELNMERKKDIVAVQIRRIFKGITVDNLANKTIKLAYEPRGFISGTGKNLGAFSPELAEEMSCFISNLYVKLFNNKTPLPIIQYGGSTDPDNLKNYLRKPSIDGVLIGGKSAKYKSFVEMNKIAKKIGIELNRKYYIDGNQKTYPTDTFDDIAKALVTAKIDTDVVETGIAPITTKIDSMNQALHRAYRAYVLWDAMYVKGDYAVVGTESEAVTLSSGSPTIGINFIVRRISTGQKIVIGEATALGASDGAREPVFLTNKQFVKDLLMKEGKELTLQKTFYGKSDIITGQKLVGKDYELTSKMIADIFGELISFEEALTQLKNKNNGKDIDAMLWIANNVLLPKLNQAIRDGKVDLADRYAVDNFIINLEKELNGCDLRFTKLTGGAVTACTVAAAHLGAMLNNMSTSKFLSYRTDINDPNSVDLSRFDESRLQPAPVVYEGKKHGGPDSTDYQEFLFIPKRGDTFLEKLNLANAFWAEYVKEHKEHGGVWMENALSYPVSSNFQPLFDMFNIAKKMNLKPGIDYTFGIDGATSEFYHKFRDDCYYFYSVEGKNNKHIYILENNEWVELGELVELKPTKDNEGLNGRYLLLSSDEQFRIVKYLALESGFPIDSFEDMASEYDYELQQRITKFLRNPETIKNMPFEALRKDGAHNVLDDFYTTNQRLAEAGVDGGTVKFAEGTSEEFSVNVLQGTTDAVLHKVNQGGPLMRTMELSEWCQRNGYGVFPSHRGQEPAMARIRADIALAMLTHPVKGDPVTDVVQPIRLKYANNIKERTIVYKYILDGIKAVNEERKLTKSSSTGSTGMVTVEELYSKLESIAYENNPKLSEDVNNMIWEQAESQGAYRASIQNFYANEGEKGFYGFTVPAINIRGLTPLFAEAIFELMIKKKVIVIFEIAKSEIDYTYQRPSEYAAAIGYAAIKTGYKGPVFLQLDHGQLKASNYKVDPNKEVNSLKNLIAEAINAGFYNIDLDTSTLVDLSKKTLDEQQYLNYLNAAQLTAYIRSLEPEGVTISVGGEIGEVGKKNSTSEELTAYMDGYKRELADIGTALVGISKISVQTGTTHGGIALPDGTIAPVKLDFETLEKLSKLAREKYGLSGAVQHGASTLPDEAFNHFPKEETAEIHLATGFQNIIYDNMPEEVRERIYNWLLTYDKDKGLNTDREKMFKQIEEGKLTKEQMLYQLRKRGFGPFKKVLWNLPEDVLGNIKAELKAKVAYMMDQLNVKSSSYIITPLTPNPKASSTGKENLVGQKEYDDIDKRITALQDEIISTESTTDSIANLMTHYTYAMQKIMNDFYGIGEMDSNLNIKLEQEIDLMAEHLKLCVFGKENTEVTCDGTIIVDPNAIKNPLQRRAFINVFNAGGKEKLEKAYSVYAEGKDPILTKVMLLSDVDFNNLPKNAILISDTATLPGIKTLKIEFAEDSKDGLFPIDHIIAMSRCILSLNNDNFERLLRSIKILAGKLGGTYNSIDNLEQILRKNTTAKDFCITLVILVLPVVEGAKLENYEKWEKLALAIYA